MRSVVIVGAGPAGAALAHLLARAGIDVTLIERHTDFAREFRGEVLMPSGIDALGQMGLGAALDALPQVRPDAIEVYRAGRRLFRFETRELAGSGPRVVSQPAMLEMLVAEAGRHAGFRLVRGATARDLVMDGPRVAGVRIDDRDGSRELRADLVIGTDGRASILRRRARLTGVDERQSFDIVWCKVPLPATPFDAGRFYFGHGHAAVALPSWDGRLQIGWVIRKGSFGDLRRQGVDAWVREMAEHVSPDLGVHLKATRHEITSPFILDVICNRLGQWTRPGLLLLGDAAHPMSPIGGQGINIALRDTLVAANHLIPVLERDAPADAIDVAAARIAPDRANEVRSVQRFQQGPPRLLFGDTAPSRVFVATLLPLLVRTGIARRVFAAGFRRFAMGVTPIRLVA